MIGTWCLITTVTPTINVLDLSEIHGFLYFLDRKHLSLSFCKDVHPLPDLSLRLFQNCYTEKPHHLVRLGSRARTRVIRFSALLDPGRNDLNGSAIHSRVSNLTFWTCEANLLILQSTAPLCRLTVVYISSRCARWTDRKDCVSVVNEAVSVLALECLCRTDECAVCAECGRLVDSARPGPTHGVLPSLRGSWLDTLGILL